MKKIFVLLLFVVTCQAIWSQELKSLSDYTANRKEVKDGRFSFYAFNTKTGQTVVAKNKNQKMIPASTLKVLTAYSSLDMLGENYTFNTSLHYHGDINASGILKGDIVIVGGGDPVLGSENFMKHYESSNTIIDQMIAAIKKAGITRIEGRIVGDDSYYNDEPLPGGWVWDDIGNYYGAGAFGLTYQENKYNVFLNSTSTVGSIVTFDNTSELLDELDYQLVAEADNISSDQVYVYSPPYADYAILRGKMPLSKSKFKIKAANPDPAFYLASDLKDALVESKIMVDGSVTTARKVRMKTGSWAHDQSMSIFEITSPKLIDIVAYMNLKSNNLIAEHLVKQISVIKGDGSGSTSDGTKEIKKWLTTKGIDSNNIRIMDGSGLSHTNLVTTSWFVRMLAKMSTESWFVQVKEALPTSGISGSMRRVGKGSVIEGKMKAKTGYLSGVRSYIGYVPNDKGELISFAVIANDYSMSASSMRKEIEKLLIALYKSEAVSKQK